MEEQKQWWASKAVWTGVIGGVFGVLAMFGVLPGELTQEAVLGAVMALTGVAGVVFRMIAKKLIS